MLDAMQDRLKECGSWPAGIVPINSVAPYEQGMPNRLLPTGQYTGQMQEDGMAEIIGRYEARTHWSEVIQEVKKGEHYVITHRGEPIAELVPPRPPNKAGTVQACCSAVARLYGPAASHNSRN